MDITPIASGIGLAIGLAIFFARQRRTADQFEPRIRAELTQNESLTLPELVQRLGMTDGFMNRGKVMNVINPMVANGELTQEEPPGTTIKDRLSVIRFRLKNRS